jgi:hypothetical protein
MNMSTRWIWLKKGKIRWNGHGFETWILVVDSGIRSSDMGRYYVCVCVCVCVKEEERKWPPMDLISRPWIGVANDVNKYY